MTQIEQGALFHAPTTAPPPRPVFAMDPDQSTNAQRVADLASLGYLPEPVLDPTFGYGGMWTEWQPDDLWRCDIDPTKAVDQVIDFTDMKFGDNTFASCLFDPPYKYQGGTSPNMNMEDRYGNSVRRTRLEVDALIEAGLRECLRVTALFVIVKCQNQIEASKLRPQTQMIAGLAADSGWRIKAELHLMNWSGVEVHGRTQQHPRNNYSTFCVFVPA